MKKSEQLAQRRFQRLATQLELFTFGWMVFLGLGLHSMLSVSLAGRLVWLEMLFSAILPAVFLAETSVKGSQSGHVAQGYRLRPLAKKNRSGHVAQGYWLRHRQGAETVFHAAVAMLAMSGLFMTIESLNQLARCLHPTIGTVWVCHRPVWIGWMTLLVVGANAGAQFMLEQTKRPLASQLRIPSLEVEAQIHRLGWMTSLSAEAGMAGLFLGWWWADGVTGLMISPAVCWVSLQCLNLIPKPKPASQAVRGKEITKPVLQPTVEIRKLPGLLPLPISLQTAPIPHEERSLQEHSIEKPAQTQHPGELLQRDSLEKPEPALHEEESIQPCKEKNHSEHVAQEERFRSRRPEKPAPILGNLNSDSGSQPDIPMLSN